jgi:eukaryotic-like serine/threonine-protein kinase
MPGQILGERYEVERQLGKKSGRWTLLARDVKTEAPVILKLLSIDEDLQPHDLKMFKREAEILKTLNHPATPRYLGYFEIDLAHGKALVLIQTYVKGKSLERSLREGLLLNEAEARRIGKAVLEILVYLHQHNPPLIHRDIKPSNVLRHDSVRSEVRLVDFGSVKSFQQTDYTSFTLVGTEGYMPPEQIGGRAVKASDLYGLGATLITAMSGLEPAKLPRRGLRIDFEQVLDLSSGFAEWLKAMVEPDLDRRFKFAQEALDALNQLPP